MHSLPVHYQWFKCVLSWFILKFHCFMLLLYLIVFKYSFFRSTIYVWYQYIQICLILGQFPCKHSLYLHYSGSACSDCTGRSGSTTYLSRFWEPFIFFSFNSISNNNFPFFFPEIGNFSGIFWSLPHRPFRRSRRHLVSGAKP